MRNITFMERLRYAFDNTMSRGVIALIGWLAVVSVVLIFIASIAVSLSGNVPVHDDGRPFNVFEVAWVSLMHTMDAGAIGGQNIDSGTTFLVPMMLATIGGIFIFSTLIGVLNSAIESKIDELRKGRSFVVEQDHIVILGWSSQIFSIISELVIANESQRKSCIVILAEKDKVEMEDEIRNKVGDTGRTRIVCRTGSPIDMTDLQIVNPDGSRAIVILPGEADNPDSHVIKTILALTNNPNRRAEPYHIISEIREADNLEVARMIGKHEAQLILASDFISRIAVQTCRQSGLSVVYTELLDFSGDEIYFCVEPTLAGKTFGEALFAYEESSVIGIKQGERVLLNPPMDTRLNADDLLVVIAEDDSMIRLSGKTSFGVNTQAIQKPHTDLAAPERTLILGWNERGSQIVNELRAYVAPNSEAMIVAGDGSIAEQIEEQCPSDEKMSVKFHHGTTTDRRLLNELNLSQYKNVIILSPMNDPQEADAQTLITLLHLRDIRQKQNLTVTIVSEMLDMRNRELAKVTNADDFIVSDKLISLMLSQIAENKDLLDVFIDLFDPEGAEIYLKPVADYVAMGQPVNFYTVMAAGLQRNEVVIGYRLERDAGAPDKQYGVTINPPKSSSVTYAAGDKVIVLADS
jgi:voltage-gated potassium channel Kch